ncbi:MAG: Ankyrin repeat domain-containing protein 11 [Caeruleum heppii]|nr:MAG: Ankyrin repeat domain-containing protein 11 [Caeruleum heppii]
MSLDVEHDQPVASLSGNSDAVQSSPANDIMDVEVAPSAPTPVSSPPMSTDPVPNVSDKVPNGVVTSEKESAKSDSEAETIVLPGKDDAARPEDRKPIKHEMGDDARTGDPTPTVDVDMVDVQQSPSGLAAEPAESERPGPSAEATEDHDDAKKRQGNTLEPGHSSSLSSALSSPVVESRSPKKDPSERKSSSMHGQDAASRIADAEGQVSKKRKLSPDSEKVQQKEPPEVNLSRNGVDNPLNERERRETRSATARPQSPRLHYTSNPNPRHSNDRSPSPRFRSHRRAASAQSNPPVSNGHPHKKRKAPPPRLATRETQGSDDNEDSSDASSSASNPPQLRPHLKTTASNEISLMSPAKMPHKKHRDQIGRTFLARACAAGEADNVITRLRDRPEDIDIADNAGNTPLQIASLEGSAEIVKILIDHGCDIDCKNYDKDTPLVDAVENGHLEVVKLLLNAGANPRQGNLNGEEPLDLLDPENQNYRAIKEALLAAKNKTHARRQSEDASGHNPSALKDGGSTTRGESAASPRHSPPMSTPRSPPLTTQPSRRKTVRSEVTRNDLLWMKPTAENLRDRAGKGDMAAVANILNVVSQADSESLIAAARGGHDEVIQLLLGIGGADADAKPIRNLETGKNTPMLAAIGRGHHKVIQLLLEQPSFDPTRTDHRGYTYYEIAQERQGFNWESEYDILKAAYDRYSKGRRPRATAIGKSASSDTQPDQQGGGRDSTRRLTKDKSSPVSATHKKKRLENAEDVNEKPGPSPGKPLRREVSERSRQSDAGVVRVAPTAVMTAKGPSEPAGKEHRKTHDNKDQGVSDIGGSATAGDNYKPRRKLVSGRKFKGDDERKRRSSNMSMASTSSVETSENDQTRTRVKSSPSTSQQSVDHKDREPSETRLGSTDKLNVSRGSASSKRPRPSASPGASRSRSRDSAARKLHRDEIKQKRRRIEREQQSNSGRAHREDSHERSTESPLRIVKSFPNSEDGSLRSSRPASPTSKVFKKSSGDTAVLVKSERASSTVSSGRPVRPQSSPQSDQVVHESSDRKDHGKQRKRGDASQHVASGTKLGQTKADPEHKLAADRAKKAKEDELQFRLEQQRETQLRFEQAAEEERVRKEAEESRRRQEAAERAVRIQAEKEEADRKERLAREAEEAKREQQRQLEEAERQARLAREEEQARIEKKRRDEEMQRRRSEQERLRREETERRRAEQEEKERLELQRQQEQQERDRLEALPWALQRLSELPSQERQSDDEAKEFLPLYTVRLAQLDSGITGPQGEELWTANFQAAAVLGVKDLALSQYTAWVRRPMTERQKVLLWRIIRTKLQGKAPLNLCGSGIVVRDRLTQAKFRAMEAVFWIKLSDILDIIPRYSHLQGVKISTLPLCDLGRKDPQTSPYASRMDANGWTVTPYKNGSFSSLSPIGDRHLSDLPPDTILFQALPKLLRSAKRDVVTSNGINGH